MGIGQAEAKQNRQRVVKAQRNYLRKKESKPSEQIGKKPKKSPTSSPWGAIYREEEMAVYTCSIRGVEYYKMVLKVYKQVPRSCN